MKLIRQFVSTSLFLTSMLASSVLLAQDSNQSMSANINAQPVSAMVGASDHTIVYPDKIKWVAAPPTFAAGAQIAVLEGDPNKAGPFTIRIKVPANYQVPPHSHPDVEHVTILEGTAAMGFGKTFDKSQMVNLPTHSFIVIQPNTVHYVLSKTPLTVQLHGIGPWKMIPANDDKNNADIQLQG